MYLKKLLNSDKEAARMAAIIMIAISSVLELVGSALIPAQMENVENIVSLLAYAFVTLGGAAWVRSKVYSKDTVTNMKKEHINSVE